MVLDLLLDAYHPVTSLATTHKQKTIS